jgi:uncharacterized membrane protein YfcA
MGESLPLLAVVAALAVVQSVFGVGLLLFGTPALLLLGLGFREALCILLPASVAVSALQVAFGREHLPRGEAAAFVCWALPALVAGLVWRLSLPSAPSADALLALLLLLGAGLRHIEALGTALRRLLGRQRQWSLAAIGLLHGCTNMGGVMLPLYASLRETEKSRITACVALGYLLFAGSQLLVLVIWRAPSDPWPAIAPAVVAAAVYLALGRRVWLAVRQRAYQTALSIFMVACAGALTLRQLV